MPAPRLRPQMWRLLRKNWEALSLSSPEEPSSCESLPSLDEPQSPVSPQDPLSLRDKLVPPPQSDATEAGEGEAPSVTVDDLDISHLQPSNVNGKGGQVGHHYISHGFSGMFHIFSLVVLLEFFWVVGN